MGGDLNARAKTWDKKYNTWGYLLEEWAAANEFVVMNDGKTETCVRAQGSSMVDVTLETEAVMKIFKSWKVDGNTESLSDHRYIRIQIESKDKTCKHIGGIEFPRWNINMNKDWFAASVIGGNWLMKHKIDKEGRSAKLNMR